jgi:hypothetical protein
MNTSTLHKLARAGAVARVAELHAELTEIQKMFPELVGYRGRLIKQRRTRKRRKMSAAARKAISDAQKARWAKQRRAKS